MLLCDAAQSVGGKLYMLGGGWTQVTVPPGTPITMALAVRVRIPWSRANDQFPIQAVLLDQNGQPVSLPGAPQIAANGVIEMGRPPGLAHGTPLDAMLSFNFPGLPLNPGAYEWVFEVEGDPKARASFTVN